jgi:hypothetical protein
VQGCQLSASTGTGTAPVPLAPCRRQKPNRAPGLIRTLTVPLRAAGASESRWTWPLASSHRARLEPESSSSSSGSPGGRPPGPWPVASPSLEQAEDLALGACTMVPRARGHWQRQLTTKAALSCFILNAHWHWQPETNKYNCSGQWPGVPMNAFHPTWTVHEFVDSRTVTL